MWLATRSLEEEDGPASGDEKKAPGVSDGPASGDRKKDDPASGSSGDGRGPAAAGAPPPAFYASRARIEW